MRKIATGLTFVALAGAPAAEAASFNGGPDGAAPVIQSDGGAGLPEVTAPSPAQKMQQVRYNLGHLILKDRNLTRIGTESASRNSTTETTRIFESGSVSPKLRAVESVYGHKGYYSFEVTYAIGSGAIKNVEMEEGGIGLHGKNIPFTTLEADTASISETTHHHGVRGQDYVKVTADPEAGNAGQATSKTLDRFENLALTIIRGAEVSSQKPVPRESQDEVQVLRRS